MVVHPLSHGISRAPRYSGFSALLSVFAYGTLTPYGRLSHAVRLTYRQFSLSLPLTPKGQVWPLPRSLATTSGISVDFFSSPYLDVSVQAVPHIYLFYSIYVDTVLTVPGFPIRISADRSRMCRSPQLFAACHVLLRLLMPRHSPCALCSLIFVGANYIPLRSLSLTSSVFREHPLHYVAPF